MTRPKIHRDDAERLLRAYNRAYLGHDDKPVTNAEVESMVDALMLTFRLGQTTTPTGHCTCGMAGCSDAGARA